jgi:membrane protein DedA with SNARE-associated domain
MRVLFNVLGVLCLPVGVVWVLQGFNVLRSSVMSGHSRWIFIGALVFLVGAAILFFNNRRKAKV